MELDEYQTWKEIQYLKQLKTIMTTQNLTNALQELNKSVSTLNSSSISSTAGTTGTATFLPNSGSVLVGNLPYYGQIDPYHTFDSSAMVKDMMKAIVKGIPDMISDLVRMLPEESDDEKDINKLHARKHLLYAKALLERDLLDTLNKKL